MVPSNGPSRKDMSFDLNLIPFIDILSVCICFLLMTTIWIHIGTMNVAQAVGEENVTGGENPPSISLMLEENGDIEVSLKDAEGAPKDLSQTRIAASNRKINWTAVESYLAALTSQVPQLKTALIMPSARSNYEDLIGLMDRVKKHQIKDIGIAPL